ncbi:MAG: hypothetical protein CME17_05040 [Gemmatimonadetes bacterium]|nr:hypothetical protein [Gemmatimonadota bacterium]|tara:strand:- start:1872 stop:2264 length:393 start_codon:yes stop_codon:yes gene_type:complete
MLDGREDLVWMILHKTRCWDTYYGPYVGVSWVGNKPPPIELLDKHDIALWCGGGDVDIDIEGDEFVGDGLVSEHIPCDYVAPYERISDSTSPIECCAGTILTADEEEQVDCPKCKRTGSLPNPRWPYPNN